MCSFSRSSSFSAASISCKTEISIASNTSLFTGMAFPNVFPIRRYQGTCNMLLWKYWFLWDPWLGVCDSVRQTRTSSWDTPITIFWLAWIMLSLWSNFAPIVIFFGVQRGTTTGSIRFKASTDGTRPFFVYSDTSNLARVMLRVDCLTDLTAET